MSRSSYCVVRWPSIGVTLLAMFVATLTVAADDSRPSRVIAQGSSSEGKSIAPTAKPSTDSAETRDQADATKAPSPALTKDAAKFGAAKVEGARKAKAAVRAAQLPGVTPEREAAVTKFVERHHPELAALLASLKASHPDEYSRAIHDLFRTSERLAQWHERDVNRYELELQLWRVQSQIDLLTAQLRMNKTDALQNHLRRAVEDQLTLRQALIKLERERVAERLKKLDEQLQSLETSRSELVERTVRLALDPPGRANAAKTGGGKPTAAKAAAGKNKAAVQGGEAKGQ